MSEVPVVWFDFWIGWFCFPHFSTRSFSTLTVARTGLHGVPSDLQRHLYWECWIGLVTLTHWHGVPTRLSLLVCACLFMRAEISYKFYARTFGKFMVVSCVIRTDWSHIRHYRLHLLWNLTFMLRYVPAAFPSRYKRLFFYLIASASHTRRTSLITGSGLFSGFSHRRNFFF